MPSASCRRSVCSPGGERERGFGLTLTEMQMLFVLGHHRSGFACSESTKMW